MFLKNWLLSFGAVVSRHAVDSISSRLWASLKNLGRIQEHTSSTAAKKGGNNLLTQAYSLLPCFIQGVVVFGDQHQQFHFPNTDLENTSKAWVRLFRNILTILLSNSKVKSRWDSQQMLYSWQSWASEARGN